MIGPIARINPLAQFLSSGRMRRSRLQHSRRALWIFPLSFLLVNLILAFLSEGSLIHLRDPEYGARQSRLLARQKEAPNQPVLLVLGSSRVAEGIRPDVLNGKAGPLVLNGGLVGSGPMLELMSYRRLKQAGLKVQGVLIEYWPPLLRGENHAEFGRIDLPRLNRCDLPIVWDYFPDPPSVTRYVTEGYFLPTARYRRNILIDVMPRLVPAAETVFRYSVGIDRWGWWPGIDEAHLEEHRLTKGFDHYKAFEPMIKDFSIGKEADRALHDLIRECQQDGVPVALIFMPEGTQFKMFYDANAEQIWQGHLKALTEEFSIPVLNTRLWEECASDMPDQVHFTQEGAARYTKRLATELPNLFPTLYGKQN